MESKATAKADGRVVTLPVRKSTQVTVSLKSLDSKDIEKARSWRNDWRIYRWCRQTDVISDFSQVDWFKAQNSDNSIMMYSIWCQTSDSHDTMVGVCGLTSMNFIARHAEFSLYIAPDIQNQGIGTLALGLLLDKAFDLYHLNLVWGEVFEGNSAAQASFEKVGFLTEGCLRQRYYKEGKLINSTIISITHGEWQNNRARVLQ